MTSFNRATLIGRLGADPEYKVIKTNDTPVANFSLATNDSFTKNGKKEQITYWHTIIAWGKLAEIAHVYLKKGSLVFIEGKIVPRSYEKDGQKIYITEIIASNIQFLEPKSNDNISSKSDEVVYEDIPF